jgi:peptidoglycan hydrolase CwlO-like protein
MGTLILVVLFMCIAAVGLVVHYKTVEGATSKINQLEATLLKLQKENLKLQNRLNDCNKTVTDLQSQLLESEKEKQSMLEHHDSSGLE